MTRLREIGERALALYRWVDSEGNPRTDWTLSRYTPLDIEGRWLPLPDHAHLLSLLDLAVGALKEIGGPIAERVLAELETKEV